jgi:hypothetical protein
MNETLDDVSIFQSLSVVEWSEPLGVLRAGINLFTVQK